jgi:hypothetical protein
MQPCSTDRDGCCGCVQDTLLPAQALHRRSSSLDTSMAGGESGKFLPHTALRRCLDAWVPLLIDECDFAAAFLLLYKPIDEVPGAPAQDPFGPGAQGKAASLCASITALFMVASQLALCQWCLGLFTGLRPTRGSTGNGKILYRACRTL